MDFKNFKKNRKNLSKSVDKLKAQKPSYIDDRFWTLTKDAAFVGEAIIRFLPQKDIDLSPVALYYKHGFQENGKWFWENCPFTLGKDCPVCDYVQPFWDEGSEPSKKKAGKYSRKKNHVANILVVKDPAKPENNGKQFLFNFGVSIFDKLMEKLAPESELSEVSMVHDLWDGQNFHLKSKKKDKYPNYDTSEFLPAKTPIAKTDKEIETFYNAIIDLNEFIDPNKFRDYKLIEEKFNTIMKIKSTNKVEVSDNTPEATEEISEESNVDSIITESNDTEEASVTLEDDSNVKATDEEDDDFNFDDDDFNFDDE